MHPVRDKMPIAEALGILGVAPPGVSTVRSQEEARAVFAEWKKTEVRPAWKELCRKHHPDLGTSDELEERTATMQRVNAAYNRLMGSQIHYQLHGPPSAAQLVAQQQAAVEQFLRMMAERMGGDVHIEFVRRPAPSRPDVSPTTTSSDMFDIKTNS